MDKGIISLILYPVLGGFLSFSQKRFIKEKFEITEDEEFSTIVNNIPSEEELDNISKGLSKEEKKKYFLLSKEIAELDMITKSQIEKFIILAKILKLSSEDTGFDFNLFDEEEVRNKELEIILNNFSLISGAIGFIPFVPISDIFILTPIQIGMITSIFKLYDFEFDVKEFLKTTGTTIGLGIVFRTASKLICNYVPYLGWLINASIAFSGTYALGLVAKSYAKEKGNISPESLKNIWENSYEDGKKEFGKLKDLILKNKDYLVGEFKKYTQKNDNNEENVNSDKQKTDKSQGQETKKKTGGAKKKKTDTDETNNDKPDEERFI